MKYLEKVKAIVSLNRLIKPTKSLSANYHINMAKDLLEAEWKIDLSDPESTSPKKLFGKTYREMSREEIAEYSQIKRIIRRYSNEQQS